MAAIALAAAATALTSTGGFVAAFGAATTISGALAASAVSGVAGIAGSYIDNAIFGSSRETVGPRLSSLNPPTATEGAILREVVGTMRVPGELIWSLTKEVVPKTQKAGKGGGGTATTFNHFGTFSLAFTQGVAAAPTTYYVNSELLDASDIPVEWYTGSETQMPDPIMTAAQGISPAYRGIAYGMFNRLPLDDYGGAFPLIEPVVTVAQPYPGLRGVVAKLAANRRLIIDTTDLDENTAITGYTVDSLSSFRGAISPLEALFDLDIIEDAGRIIVRSRRHVPLDELLETQLVARDDGGPIVWRRGAVADVPRQTTLKSIAPERGYTIRTTTPIRRTDATGEREKAFSFPGALTEESRPTLHRAAVVRGEDGRETTTFSGRLATLNRTVGDIITVGSGKHRFDAIIERQVPGSAIRYEARVISARPTLAQGVAPVALDQVFDRVAGRTTLLFMDLPALTDAERNTHQPWVAMTGEVWRGGTVWRDEGQGYEPILSLSDPADIGALTADLASGVTNAEDNANTITVRMRSDYSFEAIPFADLSGTTLNAVAVFGASGEWEVLQFSTATLTGANLWTLGGLRRGLRGTEFAMGALAGAALVVLNESIVKLPLEREQIGVAYDYRHGPSGALNDDLRVVQTRRTFGGAGLRPYAIADLDVSEIGDSAGNRITWTPRRRLSTGTAEEPLTYRLRVYDGDTILRDVTVPEPAYAYSHADMDVDHGQAVGSIDVGVSAINAADIEGPEIREAFSVNLIDGAGWTTTGTGVIVGDDLSHTPGAVNSQGRHDATFHPGDYEVIFAVTGRTAGGVRALAGGTSSILSTEGDVEANGTFTASLPGVTDQTRLALFLRTAFDGTVDLSSVILRRTGT